MKCCNYKNWFLDYVEKFGIEPEIILKRDHSMRVAENMKSIFKKSHFSEDYIELANFIGLFHDFGRFEQWKNFHSFNDNKSIDHADYSVYNLVSNGIINDLIYDRDYDDIIFSSIKYHNKLFIPKNISLKEESIFYQYLSLKEYIKVSPDVVISLYSMAIRDTDKIDILYQYMLSNYFLKTDYLPVSDKVSDDFFYHKLIDKNDRSNLNDVMVLRLSFINDINLVESLKYIKEKDIISRIENIFPDKDNLRDFFSYTRERIDKLILENNGNNYVLKK